MGLRSSESLGKAAIGSENVTMPSAKRLLAILLELICGRSISDDERGRKLAYRDDKWGTADRSN